MLLTVSSFEHLQMVLSMYSKLSVLVAAAATAASACTVSKANIGGSYTSSCPMNVVRLVLLFAVVHALPQLLSCCVAQGEAGTGNVVEAVRHCRAVMGAIRQLQSMDEDELYVYAKEIRAPVELVRQTKHLGRLPVVNFAAGGVATPADAALMMQLGMDGVFVGSGIFKSGDPARRARAIVQAVTHYNNPKVLAEVSCDLGVPMVGIDVRDKSFTPYASRSE